MYDDYNRCLIVNENVCEITFSFLCYLQTYTPLERKIYLLFQETLINALLSILLLFQKYFDLDLIQCMHRYLVNLDNVFILFTVGKKPIHRL